MALIIDRQLRVLRTVEAAPAEVRHLWPGRRDSGRLLCGLNAANLRRDPIAFDRCVEEEIPMCADCVRKAQEETP